VVDVTTAAAPRGGGRVGRAARSPESMFGGYFKMPEETLRCLPEPVVPHRRSCGIDEEANSFRRPQSRLHAPPRREYFIVEVEEVARRHPAVAELAVFGVPAEDADDEVMICVILQEGSTAEPLELARFCAENLRTSPSLAISRLSTTTTNAHWAGAEAPPAGTGRHPGDLDRVAAVSRCADDRGPPQRAGGSPRAGRRSRERRASAPCGLGSGCSAYVRVPMGSDLSVILSDTTDC